MAKVTYEDTEIDLNDKLSLGGYYILMNIVVFKFAAFVVGGGVPQPISVVLLFVLTFGFIFNMCWYFSKIIAKYTAIRVKEEMK